jgi:hypothetical protein
MADSRDVHADGATRPSASSSKRSRGLRHAHVDMSYKMHTMTSERLSHDAGHVRVES